MDEHDGQRERVYFRPREREVMLLMATEGLNREEISLRLPKKRGRKDEALEGVNISVETVQTYIESIEGKLRPLGLRGQVGIVLFCIKARMVTVEEILPWLGR